MAYTNIPYHVIAGKTDSSADDEFLGVDDTVVIIDDISVKKTPSCTKKRLIILAITLLVLLTLTTLLSILLSQKNTKKLQVNNYFDYKLCIKPYRFEGVPSTVELDNWLQNLPKCLPKFASTFSFGETFEHRPLTGIWLKEKLNKDITNRKVIWLQGGTHSKEWITVTTLIYVIDQLILLHFSSNCTHYCKKTLLYEWYIAPLINPDGFHYSRSTNKEWRKNRRPTNSEKTCYGVDLNRNWAFKWKDSSIIDEDVNDPCGNNYAGISSFSEAETKGVSEVISNLHEQGDVELFISLHSLGQKWLLPWSYTSEQPTRYSTMWKVAEKGKTAIEKCHQSKWILGQASHVQYACSGTALDWAASLGIPYVYTLELRPVDHTTYGHFPPLAEIVKCGEEFWSGLHAIVQQLT